MSDPNVNSDNPFAGYTPRPASAALPAGMSDLDAIPVSSQHEITEYSQNILDHKTLVAHFMTLAIAELTKRAVLHDFSKFGSSEFWAYARALPRFKEAEYGSEEYRACVRSIQTSIDHHVHGNRHHPEYFGDDGINGMNLIDVLEMICDWIAASKRVEGDTLRLDINKKRFGIDDQLFGLIARTVAYLTESSAE